MRACQRHATPQPWVRRLGRRTQGRRKPNQGTLKECYRRTRRFTAASDDSWRNTAERCAWPRLDGGSVTQLSHSFRVPVGLGVLPRVRRPRRRLWALEFHAVGMFRGTPHALCAGAMQRFSRASAGFHWERRLLMGCSVALFRAQKSVIHIGHLVECIQSDIWVRFQKLRGHRCIYSGTRQQRSCVNRRPD